jgi:hypothetical protein
MAQSPDIDQPPVHGGHDLPGDDRPTDFAEPVFIETQRAAIARTGPEPAVAATAAAEVEFRFHEAKAIVRMAERHTPQLLDVLVFGGGAASVVAGPVWTCAKAGSYPAVVVLLICIVEVLGVLTGMVIYRLRR